MEGKKIFLGGQRPWPKKILHFLEAGGVMIAFEQDFLPSWLPLNVTINKMHDSTVCFCGKGAHPVLNGINDEDLRFWRMDHVVSKYDINLPVIGDYRSIVDSGGTGGLVYSPMLELNHGKGCMILCQMQVSEKWENEPIAGMLIKNLLEYAIKKQKGLKSASSIDDKENIKNRMSEDVKKDTTGVGPEMFKVGGFFCEGDGIKIFEGIHGLKGFYREKDKVMDFVKSGGKVILRGIDSENQIWLKEILPIRLREIGKDELPLQVLDDRKILLYNRDLYWLKPHSEFSRGWADFDEGIAEFAVNPNTPEQEAGPFFFKPLTKPNVLVKICYGKGYFLIDQVKWDHPGFNAEKGFRYASSILQYVGARVLKEEGPFTDTAVIQVENMACRTPGQPLIRCRSHDYWTICSANYVSDVISFLSSGRYKIVVRAKSRRYNQIPVMGLLIDKKVMDMAPVTSIYWDTYNFTVALEKGEHEIGICLLNSEDPYDEKYLYLDWIYIEKVSPQRTQRKENDKRFE